MNENCLFENRDFNELTKIFIKKAMIIHGEDEFDYSLVEYVNQFTHVELICRQGHIFKQTPKAHINGRGCCFCGKMSKGGMDKFLDNAKKVHGDKYDYSEVIYKNYRQKVVIKCKNGHTFLQTPGHHILSMTGCPTCAGNIPYTKETFLIKAKEVHGEKYSYFIEDKVTTSTKINILCNTCGEKFIQCIGNHINQKNGCSNCSRKKPLTNETFILAAKKAHPNEKFSYEKVQYVNINTKVTIICPKGHIFYQTPSNHIHNKFGCLECSGNKPYTTETFILKAQEVHGKNKYNYDKVEYINRSTPVKITCQKGHLFSTKPSSHLIGHNCNMCVFCTECGLFRSNGTLCIFCKPKSINKLYFKTKEWQIVKFLREKLPNNDFIHNKSVGSDCTGSHLFPDILYDVNEYFLIVEIDEKQHRGYDKNCEKSRMIEIGSKLGLPCVFLRYNPDNTLSNKNILLKRVKYFLKNKPVFEDFTGLFIEYLFYK